MDEHVSGSTLVDLQGVSVRYGEKVAVDDCSLTINAGESVAFLGPNGAGKTTLLEVIEGFRAPSAGHVEVFGTNPLHFGPRETGRLGVVLQSWKDHAAWKVEEFLSLVEYAHKAVRPAGGYTKTDLIGILNLGETLDKKLSKLSGGQRRRVDVCAAMLGAPELLILDEPTTAFDPEVHRNFHQFMNDIRSTTTLIWATHDLNEAENNCDRIILLKQGKILYDNTPDGLRAMAAQGTMVQWRDRDGNVHSQVTDNPNELIVTVIAEGASDLKVGTNSFEEVYLDLISSAAPKEGV